MMPKDSLGVGQALQRLSPHTRGQEPDLPPKAREELTGDMGKDSEWLNATAIDPALYLKDL